MVRDIEGYQREIADAVEKNQKIYEEIIINLNKLISNTRQNEDLKTAFNRRYTKLGQEKRVFLKKSFLVRTMKIMLAEGRLVPHDRLAILLQRKSRQISGITNVTLMTSPYPDGQKFSCKHNCYYCPNEPGQPRSYLSKEPAVARANRHDFEAIGQCSSRLTTLETIGYDLDKVELIISGGTFTEYPVPYLENFIRDAVYACNTYYDGREKKMDILSEIEQNRTAIVRIIGITIETRPDAIDTKWMRLLRRWGVTRVQLGVQHLDPTILKTINRGHGVQEVVNAFRLLKNACFKIDIHLMPDLPGSDPTGDMKMFDRVYSEPEFAVDQIKIYPCQTTPWSVIKGWHESGKYIPYSESLGQEVLENVVRYAMETCPPWIRLPRVVRDIPLTYISAGCQRPDLRDKINKTMNESADIRFREAGRHLGYRHEDAELVIRQYFGNGGTEYFISYESRDRKVIFGLLRLRVTEDVTVFPCLQNKGLVRELHVYGQVVSSKNYSNRVQHSGIGTRLLRRAEWIAWQNCCEGTAVISGMGVTDYYCKKGYRNSGQNDGSYFVKDFKHLWVPPIRRHLVDSPMGVILGCLYIGAFFHSLALYMLVIVGCGGTLLVSVCLTAKHWFDWGPVLRAGLPSPTFGRL
uniref:Radical SAM core domain-containing protein n=1 Tax=viral metagenome TaxID=1070528 RepID=A0A6C0K9M1_9ZZZZ